MLLRLPRTSRESALVRGSDAVDDGGVVAPEGAGDGRAGQAAHLEERPDGLPSSGDAGFAIASGHLVEGGVEGFARVEDEPEELAVLEPEAEEGGRHVVVPGQRCRMLRAPEMNARAE